MTLQTKSNFPLYCLVTLIYSTTKNLASNRGKSEDFDACRSQGHIIKNYVVFKMAIEVYQEWDAFVRQTVHFALWSGNTKPFSTLDHKRNSKEILKDRDNLFFQSSFTTPGITKTNFSPFKIRSSIFPHHISSTKDF